MECVSVEWEKCGVESMCDVYMYMCVSLSKVVTKPKKKRPPKEGEGEGEGEGGGGEKGKGRKRSASQRESRQPKKRRGDPGYDPYDFTSSESEGEAPGSAFSPEERVEPMDTGPTHLSDERCALFFSPS